MALSLSDNSQFFGMDLSQCQRQWRGAADMLFALPGLRMLSAPVPVRLVQVDGGISDWQWRGGLITARVGKLSGPAALAVEMSAEAVLERTLTLPLLNQADIAEAVALEANSISPFGPAQTVSGYAVEPAAKGANTQTVHMALTSRKQLEQRVQMAQSVLQVEGDALVQIEAWVLPHSRFNDGGGKGILPLRPIVFNTEGVEPRQTQTRKGRAGRIALLLLTGLLLAAIAATPVLQARQRAMQAQASLDRVTQEAAPQMAQREALVKQAEALRSVGEVMKTQLAPMPVLDLVTRTLPDTAWLQSLRIEGDKVILSGNGDDAAALVQTFSQQEGVKQVRLPSPATRPAGATKENFTIELVLDSARYGLAKAQGAV